MKELVSSALAFTLWPLLSLAILGLWISASLDIARYRHARAFTNAKLLYMVALVSVVAVIAIAGIGAVFGGQWSEAISSPPSAEPQAEKQDETPARAYIFSFGLEHASF